MYKDLLLHVHWHIPCNINSPPANSPNLSLLVYYQFLWITSSYVQSPRKSLFFQLPFATYVPVFKSGTRSYQYLLHLMSRSFLVLSHPTVIARLQSAFLPPASHYCPLPSAAIASGFSKRGRGLPWLSTLSHLIIGFLLPLRSWQGKCSPLRLSSS